MGITTSVRTQFLPFAQPDIGEKEIAEVVDTLKSGWITTGPKTKTFEERMAQYLEAKHTVAVNSCTGALHLGLAAAGVGRDDEVITTPLTFCSTANVIIHLGARPVFADIGDDYNIDPAEIEARITPRTKAIIPVHFGGQPCQMDAIMACAARHRIPVIEDAAHAIGARYGECMIGTIGDITTFSFYAIKNLTTAEGGMIATADEELAEKIRLLSLHGISKDAWKRYTSEGSWYYEVLFAGFKYNMTDIQAALGLQQLERLEDFITTRARYARIYNDAFQDLPEVRIPLVNEGIRHAWHLYVIQLNLERLTIDRSQFIEALRAENIGTSVHFIPVHLHPYYRDTYGYARGDYPKAEHVYDRIISLPLYPKMTEEDVHDVITAVKRVIDMHKK